MVPSERKESVCQLAVDHARFRAQRTMKIERNAVLDQIRQRGAGEVCSSREWYGRRSLVRVCALITSAVDGCGHVIISLPGQNAAVDKS